MQEIKGKRIVGYSFADGIHWHWGNEEIAVIDELRREIEWRCPKYKLPQEVIDVIRNKMPETPGKWTIEVRRVRTSATQGSIHIFVNGEDMNLAFEDKFKLDENGEWKSATPDGELGKFIYACLWHKLDDLYHYSDRFRDLFRSDWRENG